MGFDHRLFLIRLSLILLVLFCVGCQAAGSGQAPIPAMLPDTEQPASTNQVRQVPQQDATNSYEIHSMNPAAVEVIQPTMQITTTPHQENHALPEEHFIWNIWGHRQYFDIGCEASTVRDWAGYFGVEIHESNFQFQLPASDNPDFGFVGSVTDPWGQVPPFSYGVHAYPVANLLRSAYGMNARGVKHFTTEQLKREIAANRPVIAWVIGNVVGGIPYLYTDKESRQVIVAAYEHVVIVTGYNREKIRYMNNGRFYDIPVETFLNSWKVLENMVVVLEK